MPQVVVWELAERMQGSLRSALGQLESLPLEAVVSELQELDRAATVRLQSWLQASGAQIRDASQAAYRSALQAQVLQTSPATKKGQTKTGAADYVVLATCREIAQRGLQPVLLTNDQELTRAASEHGITVYPGR